MGNMLGGLALRYLEDHPDQVAALFEEGAKALAGALISALKKHNAAKAGS